MQRSKNEKTFGRHSGMLFSLFKGDSFLTPRNSNSHRSQNIQPLLAGCLLANNRYFIKYYLYTNILKNDDVNHSYFILTLCICSAHDKSKTWVRQPPLQIRLKILSSLKFRLYT